MARRHLLDAAAVSEWMAANHPAEYADLAARIHLRTNETRQWQYAAEAMHLLVDKALDTFPQDDGFLHKARMPSSIAGWVTEPGSHARRDEIAAKAVHSLCRAA